MKTSLPRKKPPKITIFKKQTAIDLLFFIFGALLYSLGINSFIEPAQLSTGGITGVAMMLSHLSGFPIGTGVLLLNLPLFVAALWKFGVLFLGKTAVATVLCSVLIDILEPVLPVYSGENTLLSAIFGGALLGLGIGLVFLRGGTTGGTDIIAKLIRKRHPQFSMGTVVFLLDAVIVGASYFVYSSIETLLYSSIVFFISSRAIDYLLFGSVRSKLLIIVTEKGKAVTRKLTANLPHGVTVLSATGGYTEKEKNMLMCVVRPNELTKAIKLVNESDSDSFTVVTDAGEVLGLGFQKELQ